MANDKVTSSCAATRDVCSDVPQSQQDCADCIHISVFFDGTGNNKDADEATKKWSNVARIWRSSQLFADNNVNAYPVYISGVGTPFNGTVLSKDLLDVTIEDHATGLVGGAGGDRRLKLGNQQINDAVRTALLAKAATLGGQVAAYAKKGQSKGFAEVNSKLAQHSLIKQINVSIFGFSRGAALARTFCNQWLWDCKESHGQLTYEGHPIRFEFLGLFDTVASFGLPATNSANTLVGGGFKGRDLVVDKRVERCVHYVAGHELRFSFPVDLIRKNGKLAGPWLETVYPGVHSDVGGGYTPDDQGVDNNYARIPMRDMMRESLLAGTRLVGYQDLSKNKDYAAIFRERFECKPETEAAYQAYMSAYSGGGTIEKQKQNHMALLYSAYGSLYRAGIPTVDVRRRKEGASWSVLAADSMGEELERYQQAITTFKNTPGTIAKTLLNPSVSGALDLVPSEIYMVKAGLYAILISPAKWQINAWKKTAPDGVKNFVQKFIHDSKVDFISNAEPCSYFANRGIYESSHSIQGWFDESVERPVSHAAEEVTDAAKAAAKKAADVVKSVEQKVTDVVKSVEQKTVETAKSVAHKISDAATSAEQYSGKLLNNAGNVLSNEAKNAANIVENAWGYLKSSW